MSRSRVLTASAAVLLSVATLTGCTVGSADPGPTGSPEAAPGPSETAEEPSQPAPDPSLVGDVSPEELSEAVFAAGTEWAQAPPVASVTGTVAESFPVDATLDVLAVEPVDSGTLVRFRLSSEQTRQLNPAWFASPRNGNRFFVRDVYLEVPEQDLRLLPLQFEDYRPGCVCPFRSAELGPEPLVLTALFETLPEGTEAVTVALAGSGLVAPDVPVG